MKTCRNCNHELQPNTKFCLNCGAPIEEADQLGQNKRSNSKKLGMKKKIGIISAIVVVIAVIATHFIIKSMLDPVKTIKNMQTAYTQQNYSKFIHYFTLPDDVQSDNKGFYQYMDSNDWSSIRQQMLIDAKKVENGGIVDIITDDNGNKIVSVEEEPFLGGLYHRIKFRLHPVSVSVEAPYDDFTFSVGDKSIKTVAEKKEKLGYFLPGSYEWQTNVKNEYIDISRKGNFKVKSNGKNTFTLKPELKVSMVKLTSDVKDATVFINGKSTGKTANKLSEIGPLPLDGSVKVYAKGKDDSGKMVKSDELKVENEEENIQFAFYQKKLEEKAQQEEEREYLEENRSEIQSFLEDFRDAYQDALDYRDFSYISSYFQEGEAKEDIQNHVEDTEDDQSYNFQDINIEDIKLLADNVFQVKTNEEFQFSGDDDYWQYERVKTYIIVKDASEFSIKDIKYNNTNKYKIDSEEFDY